jgi:hypothetical protein
VVRDMVFNTTFNNISIISWMSVLLVEETGVPVSVLLIFLVFCVVYFCFACLVYPMLPVSLDCPFLIPHSVFSNVYLLQFHA